MKRIEEIKIQNYRGIDDLEFKPKMINIFVGKNNAGKSSVLNAIFLNLLGLHEYKKRSTNLVTNISNLLVDPLKYEIFNDHQEGYIELRMTGDANKSIHTRLELK